MARATKAKGPDAELEELKARRVSLAGKRHEVEGVGSAARAVLDGIPERRRAAVNADVDGDKGAETIEQVDRARQSAEGAIAECAERADVIRQKESAIGEEADAVVDANPDYYINAAETASAEAQQAIGVATEATQAAVTSWQAAYSAWGRVRKSRNRRGLELTPEVPMHDLGVAVNELQKAQTTPWPTGSKERWEQFLAHEAAARARGGKTSLTRSEVLAGFDAE